MGRRAAERRSHKRAERTARTAPRGSYDAMGFPHDEGEPATVRLEGVRKVYGEGAAGVAALDGVTVHFAPGSFTAVMGPAGSGKSTLLQCAAGLDRTTAGTVSLEGRDLGTMNESALAKLRRERIGFVYQSLNLLPALAVRPAVLFADEPTSALEAQTATEVLELLRQTVHQDGQTVIMVTHDPVAASYADRVLFLADGRIADEMSAPAAERIAERMSRPWDSGPGGVPAGRGHTEAGSAECHGGALRTA